MFNVPEPESINTNLNHHASCTQRTMYTMYNVPYYGTAMNIKYTIQYKTEITNFLVFLSLAVGFEANCFVFTVEKVDDCLLVA